MGGGLGCRVFLGGGFVCFLCLDFLQEGQLGGGNVTRREWFLFRHCTPTPEQAIEFGLDGVFVVGLVSDYGSSFGGRVRCCAHCVRLIALQTAIEALEKVLVAFDDTTNGLRIYSIFIWHYYGRLFLGLPYCVPVGSEFPAMLARFPDAVDVVFPVWGRDVVGNLQR